MRSRDRGCVRNKLNQALLRAVSHHWLVWFHLYIHALMFHWLPKSLDTSPKPGPTSFFLSGASLGPRGWQKMETSRWIFAYDAPYAVDKLSIMNLCLCFYFCMYSMVESFISTCVWLYLGSREYWLLDLTLAEIKKRRIGYPYGSCRTSKKDASLAEERLADNDRSSQIPTLQCWRTTQVNHGPWWWKTKIIIIIILIILIIIIVVIGVFLWWCFLCLCGGVFVVVVFLWRCRGGVFVVAFLWWRFCGGVLVVVFLWWCFCGRVFVVVFLWWCFCGSVFVVVFLWWCWFGPVLEVVCWCFVVVCVCSAVVGGCCCPCTAGR